MNFFRKAIKQKVPIPMEIEVNIALNKYKKEELLDLFEKFILNAYHYNSIGNAFRYQNEYDLAEKAFLDAIDLLPEYDEPYGNLISLYVIQEKYDLCEGIYRKGMDHATKKSFIIYQDGRLAFMKGKFEQSLMAARSILIDEKMNEESAFVLGIHSLLSLVKENKDIEKNYDDADSMLKTGLSLFPDSQDLNNLSKYFTDDE